MDALLRTTLFTFPVYNAALESEQNVINIDHVERIKPHANVAVDPGAVDTECCEFLFVFGTSCIVLRPYAVIRAGMNINFGIIDEFGDMI